MNRPADAGLVRLLRASTGLNLTAATVARAVRERLRATGADDAADYAPHPGSAEFEALVDLVVVPESWMLRDPKVFEEALRFVQRRLLVRPERQVRVLSLPCAGGEEPYSMALALERAGIEPRHCRIDAFDLSQAAIARARGGRYTRNAFRGTDDAFRDRHFRRDGDDYVIGAAPRAYVGFEQGNLFTLDLAARAGRYDLVFCRNLLIYFDAAGQAEAAARLALLLADDGLLMSGYAEMPTFCRHGFAPLSLRDTFALCKQPQDAVPAGSQSWLRALAVPSAARAAAAPAPVAAPAAPPGAPRDPLEDARRHADAGRLAEAAQACRHLLALQPEYADAWFLLGMVAECAGEADSAARHWRCCVYLDPEHYEALCGLALLHERGGDSALGATFRRRAARVFQRRGSVDA